MPCQDPCPAFAAMLTAAPACRPAGLGFCSRQPVPRALDLLAPQELANRAASRRRAEQPGDQPAAIPIAPHRPQPPVLDLPEAGHHIACRAGSRRGRLSRSGIGHQVLTSSFITPISGTLSHASCRRDPRLAGHSGVWRMQGEVRKSATHGQVGARMTGVVNTLPAADSEVRTGAQ